MSSHNNKNLDGKVAIVTGASKGIGAAIAKQLAAEGAAVVVNYSSSRADGEKVAKEITALGGTAIAVQANLSKREEIERLFAKSKELFGRLDILVNNAGIYEMLPLDKLTEEHFHKQFNLNVLGLLFASQAAAKQFGATGGSIINISSVVGKLVTPANGTYSASKFALEALSDALRLELAPFGIRVVLVEPGSVKTHFADAAAAKAQAILSNPSSPYRALYRKHQQVNASMRRGEAEPEAVSRVIQQAIEAPRPKARYLAGFSLSGRLVMALRDFLWEPVVRQMFKISLDEADLTGPIANLSGPIEQARVDGR